MKQILFATGNQSKAKRFSKGLWEKGIEVVSLRDLGIKLDVKEDGTNAIENASIKAKAGFAETHMPTIGMDDSLYIENVPEDKQPGLYVRRINGKTLNDEEMIEYYTKLVNEYGIDGKLNCKWVYGLAAINEEGKINTYTWFKDNFYMVNTLSDKMDPDYPLNSISKYKGLDKYFTDITDEKMNLIHVSEDDVVDFIAEHVV